MVSSRGARRASLSWPADDSLPTVADSGPMRVLRRVLSVLILAGAIAATLRIRGTGGTPPQHGGWRPLDMNEN